MNRMISSRLKSLQLSIYSSQKADISNLFGALRFTKLDDINLYTENDRDTCPLPILPEIENIFEAKFLCLERFELPLELLILVLRKHRLQGWKSFEIGYSLPFKTQDKSMWKKLETRIIFSTSAMAPGCYMQLDDRWSQVLKNEYTEGFGALVKYPW